MSRYDQVLQEVRQLTPAEQKQLQQELEPLQAIQHSLHNIAETANLDPILALIGCIDEEPATGNLTTLDAELYGQ